VSRLDGSMVREARLRASPARTFFLAQPFHTTGPPNGPHRCALCTVTIAVTDRVTPARAPVVQWCLMQARSVNDRPRPRFLPSRTIPLFKSAAEYSSSRNCRWHLNHANSLPELEHSLTPQLKRLCRQNLAGFAEIRASFQTDILRRHF